MKNLTNLETVLVLNVNMYEIEDSILKGESFYKTHDNTFFFMEIETRKVENYTTAKNEVILNTNEGTSIIIKKI